LGDAAWTAVVVLITTQLTCRRAALWILTPANAAIGDFFAHALNTGI